MTFEGHEYTHKGWFWFCPIYLDLSDDVPTVTTRHGWLEPLFWLASGLEWVRITATGFVLPDWEPTFMFSVTGEV